MKQVKKELIGSEGMVLLDTIRRLNRRNAVDRLMKLLNKTHPADIAWVFRHLTPIERSHIFNIIAHFIGGKSIKGSILYARQLIRNTSIKKGNTVYFSYYQD